MNFQQLRSVREAVRCGFKSVQYLHAVFRRELGCTPREYQARESAGEAV